MEVVSTVNGGSVDPSDMAAVGDTSFVGFSFVCPLNLEAQDMDAAFNHAFALAADASTTKLPSPRGQKRGRGTADDDDAGGARGGKRDVATQVSEADLLPPSVMRDASTQYPEVEEERSVDAARRERSPPVVDNDQGLIAAGSDWFTDWTVLGVGDDSSVPPELDLELLLVDRTDEGRARRRHCHGGVAPDAVGNVSEEEVQLQQLPPFHHSTDFTEAATDEDYVAAPSEEDFRDLFEDFCQKHC